MKNILLVLCTLTCLTASARPKFRIFNFEIGGIRVTHDSGKTAAFIDSAWTPMWDAEDFGVHGFLQLTAGRSPTDKRMVITSYGGSLFVRVYSLINIEGTGGIQSWHDSAYSAKPILGGAILLRVGEEFFDRIYIGYQRVLSPVTPAGILRCGFAFTF